jgi:uncharacterized protein (DUF4415 family)
MKRTAAKKKKGYTARDMRAVSDNPEWTKADFAKARLFDEVFPNLRRRRGPNKSPTKTQVTLRLNPAVLDYFKEKGPGWQSRINDELEKVVKGKERQRPLRG